MNINDHSLLVSVVIPTYNRATELRRCLLSLECQIFKNFEVLVCDDGSIDNTFSVINEFHNTLSIRYFCNRNFGGPARPRNIGVSNSIGKYIAFLDSDDWWTPSKLLVSVSKLEEGFDLIYHDLYIIKESQVNTFLCPKTKSRQLSDRVFEDLLFNGNPIPNSSAVVRRDIINLIYPISEDRELIAAEDYDTWLRISKFTNKFVRVSGTYGFYSKGHVSLSSSSRSILNINFIFTKYSNELSAADTVMPPWARYGLGRAHLINKNYKIALSFFYYLLTTKCSVQIKIRSFINIMLLSFLFTYCRLHILWSKYL